MGMFKPPKVASRPAEGLRGAVSAPAGYRATPGEKYVSKMRKKYYLKLKEYVAHQVLRPANVFTNLGTYKLLTDPRVLYNN